MGSTVWEDRTRTRTGLGFDSRQLHMTEIYVYFALALLFALGVGYVFGRSGVYERGFLAGVAHERKMRNGR